MKWIAYSIPNNKDLLQKLHSAFIYSKFDMQSGFQQIQIHPKDRYIWYGMFMIESILEILHKSIVQDEEDTSENQKLVECR